MLTKKNLADGWSPSTAGVMAGHAMEVRSTQVDNYVERLETCSQEAGFSLGLTAEKVDVHALEGNVKGAGRPSAWDEGSRARLVACLTTLPKTGSGATLCSSSRRSSRSDGVSTRRPLFGCLDLLDARAARVGQEA